MAFAYDLIWQSAPPVSFTKIKLYSLCLNQKKKLRSAQQSHGHHLHIKTKRINKMVFLRWKHS